MVLSDFHGRCALRISFVIGALIVFMVLLTGCVSRQGEKETPAAPQPTVLPSAPKQLYIKAGQLEQFTYRGHDIRVNYTSAYPTQLFNVAVDGNEKLLRKEPTESPNGIYWKEGDLSFTIKPVVWEMREGQNVPIYESTWNTSEVYFEVRVISLPSEVTGGPP